MKYAIIHPDLRLQAYVQYFWTLEAEPDNCQRDIRTFVDDSSGILMEFSSGKNDGTLQRTMVYGQTTTPTLNQNQKPFSVVGVLFHPCAINELFHLHAYELTNRRIGLDDFLKVGISEAIASKKTRSDKLNFLSHYLFSRLSTSESADHLIRHCVAYIRQQGGMLTVKDLQVKFRISEKGLERKFKEVIGVSPRHYLKVSRFRQAVKLLSGKAAGTMTDITYELGYFDQSHFIKQTKELSGLNPGALKKELTASVANLIV
ncbi:DUF6597 domain-containing transcriptional factor [Haoranjiania flava]|uniref:Helix-turn-helix domain-containing protein n=1 Tax=Haoranjiania flava TaxID=1856322 RepID=A0AAE3ILR8_9BACT|nr:helix-turn-helix domain-containing protein [Haoranjiania flava]MCU7693260.1 helix-turn-helix domain-containing protein [Haoranjiania flava]